MKPRFSPRSGPALAALLALTFAPIAASASDAANPWLDGAERATKTDVERQIVPERYRAVGLDLGALDDLLVTAPLETTFDLRQADSKAALELALPMPDGSFARFRVVESPIMAPELAAKFPEIRTFRGQGIDDPSMSVRFDRTPAGFHGMLSTAGGTVYIDPYSRQHTDLYISYWTHDLRREGPAFSCTVEDPDAPGSPFAEAERSAPLDSAAGTVATTAAPVRRAATKAVSGTTLRTYRLAVAATGEYTQFHGGSVAQGQAAIVTAMNRVNQIYEQEVAIRMVLVANNDQVVYTNGATDPYANNNGNTMLGQNASNLASVIGNANFDIGHVFSTGGGGVAVLRGPCGGNKARGVTGLPAPTGDPFWVDFVAHEMGHQWGGNHTFNGSEGSCAGGNRNASTAYEPGSGTTIQAYAGICGSQNLQNNSDPYFHGISLDEIIGFSALGSGDSCAASTATGNGPPTVEAGPAYVIPVGTAFELCGSAIDPQADPLTFAWEEFDLGPAGAPQNPSGNAPIFRSFEPTASPCRSFPRLSDLAADSLVLGEQLPSYARTMTFRLTARDNRSGGGGVADDETTVEVIDTAGPFQVTGPDGSSNLAQGSAAAVTWTVADTDQAPINCAIVDILLSTDGGQTYPIELADDTLNDGAEAVTLPDQSVEEASILVRCATSIFFDVSPARFGIGVPLIEITAPSSGATSTQGDEVTFAGNASDPEDGSLSPVIEWTSSLDGPIGTGSSFSTTNLSLGIHTITASATDTDTNTVSAEILVEVLPPCVDLEYDAGYESDEDGWEDGASTCSTGTFVRGTPDLVSAGAIDTQPGGAATGSFAWFTQNNAGGAGTDDVDGGTCETLSPVINVSPGTPVTVLVDYFHGQRDAGGDPDDGFSIELLDGSGGSTLATLVSIGDVTNDAAWTTAWAQVPSGPTSVRLRVRATDGLTAGDLVEGGIDNVRVCTGLPSGLFGDGFESGNTAVWSNTSP